MLIIIRLFNSQGADTLIDAKMKQFKKYMEKYTSVSSNEWEIISQTFTQQKYLKNEIILNEGETCRYFYYLGRGLLRSYYSYDGCDVVKSFIFPPFGFTSGASFVNRLPAIESIQAIEESYVWKINYEQYQQLMQLSSWTKFTHGLLSESDNSSKQMIIQLKSQTPGQRYRWLTQNYHPSQLQQIPQKYLASYLGVAPQSLCRIKNKLYKDRRLLGFGQKNKSVAP
ncbi:MAG: Crp/Fnr family transcriptional regulator [Prolixibacteraceae bacterium]|nr:Crp/Fnr family transcriptional regulator [Prolixibacteraceae bacterium]MBN2650389.1 Crp/Fnr family transcriptional regulator [Prolixibacteraceae bacterium]